MLCDWLHVVMIGLEMAASIISCQTISKPAKHLGLPKDKGAKKSNGLSCPPHNCCFWLCNTVLLDKFPFEMPTPFSLEDVPNLNDLGVSHGGYILYCSSCVKVLNIRNH